MQGQLTVPEVHEVAVKALQLALSQPQYEAGFVLDGVGSKHLPGAAFAARCMLQAVGLQNKALLSAEPTAASLSASGAASKTAKRAKGSRPSSSKPGARNSLVPEVPPAIVDLSKPDVWEGTQQVGIGTDMNFSGKSAHIMIRAYASCLVHICSPLSLWCVCPLQVFAVQLQLSKAEACRRFAAAAAAAAAGLEVSCIDCAASGLLVEASFMGQQQQEQVQQQTQLPEAVVGSAVPQVRHLQTPIAARSAITMPAFLVAAVRYDRQVCRTQQQHLNNRLTPKPQHTAALPGHGWRAGLRGSGSARHAAD
jgi:hypothetical protein